MLLALAAAFVLLTALAGFYIDVLWFREVRFSGVFWTVLWTRILLAVVFGLIFFAILYANLLIARAIRPRYPVFSPGEEAVDRYRVAIEPYAKWILPGVALLFAAFAATGVAGQWEAFQQWRVSGSVSFGVQDPIFHRDISFFVLSLPFLKFVQGWLISSLIVVTVVTAGAHYLWSGIRFRAVGERVTAQVKAHLSVLLGLIVLVKAWGYRLGQFDLLVSERGTVTGASYTDVNAQLPALKLLVLIAVVCALLFLVNIRFRGWALPAVALALLALVSVVAGAGYPAAVQRFRVAPQELQREQPYIEQNIEFTRRAYGLSDVEMRSFPAEPEVSAEEIESSSDTIEDIRVWNPAVLRDAYLQLQRIRPYYEFVDVDVDRYEVEGERRLVMVAPREITQEGIPGGGRTWQNQHLFYTHGYGVAAARANEVVREGIPDLVLADIPPDGVLASQLGEPRIYFQEETHVPFVMVKTDMDELDYPTGDAAFARTQYEGEGGIEMGGFLRRAAFAWRYRDVNLLISGLIDGDSRILINHDISTRVQKVAPFLKYDSDPYLAMVDGRVLWVWDAYTTTNQYPYSERVDLSAISNLPGQVNYIRNSVKVVVDAYDGTMTFYVVDEEDPIIQAWQKVFPDLFEPASTASTGLREHFRYPEDLFKVQASQFANYHVTEPSQFYAKEDFWAIPEVPIDPTAESEAQLSQLLDPYYVLLTLPGEEEAGEQFLLFTPFTPAERPQMVAWMAAISDPEDYGRMVTYEFPLERNVPGPENVAAYIAQDTEVSQQISLWDQLGSRVIHGDLLVIPVGQSFLYVQPLYLQSSATGSAIPELKRVVVVSGDAVTMGTSLETALTEAFGLDEEPVPEPEPTPEPTPGPEDPTVPPGVRALLREAQAHYDAAQEALLAGDLATYQDEIEAMGEAIRRANELLDQAA